MDSYFFLNMTKMTLKTVCIFRDLSVLFKSE